MKPEDFKEHMYILNHNRSIYIYEIIEIASDWVSIHGKYSDNTDIKFDNTSPYAVDCIIDVQKMRKVKLQQLNI